MKNAFVQIEETIPDIKPVVNTDVKPNKKGSGDKSPFHKPFISTFSSFYEKMFRAKFSWRNGKHHTAIKNCITEVKEAYRLSGNTDPTTEQMVVAFEAILERAYKDKWFRQNFEPSLIASKFNNLKSNHNDGQKQVYANVLDKIRKAGSEDTIHNRL